MRCRWRRGSGCARARGLDRKHAERKRERRRVQRGGGPRARGSRLRATRRDDRDRRRRRCAVGRVGLTSEPSQGAFLARASGRLCPGRCDSATSSRLADHARARRARRLGDRGSETRRVARPSEAGTPSSRSRSRDDARRVVSARRRRVTAEAASKDRARHQRKGGTVAQEITPAPPTVRSQAHDVQRSRRQLYHVCLEVHAVQQSSFGASERREVNCARRGARRDFAAARSRRARSGPLARLAMKRRTRLLGLGRQALSE